MITIYTDGACSGNPGIGGWGVIILEENKNEICLNGGNNNTTNNRMELTAAPEVYDLDNHSRELYKGGLTGIRQSEN